jgi:membrane fusion protein (multidrug efflux system)
MRKKLLLVLLPVVLIAAGVCGGWYWWRVWRFQQSTEDAYVASDISLIAPTVEGTIKEVRVRDNERVKAGQILFLIDDDDFIARFNQAEAVVGNEEAALVTYDTRRFLQFAMINQAAAAMHAAEAEVNRANLDQKRYESLIGSEVATRQRYETAVTDASKAAAALLRAQASLQAEREQLAVIDAQKHEQEAKLTQARVALKLAKNQLNDTIIRAPVDGVIGNRAGQIGQYVRPGTQLCSLVPLPYVYVTANFKETQLTLMRPGQPAEILVDAYPDQIIQGRVESFAPASGAQFSLLPPDNATGNFTKIVQRVPVRIAVPEGGPLAALLRPGLSVQVTVDTRAPGNETPDGAIVGALEVKTAQSPR